LNCGVDHVLTLLESSQLLDHREYGVRTS
jgi:hypothetical protein